MLATGEMLLVFTFLVLLRLCTSVCVLCVHKNDTRYYGINVFELSQVFFLVTGAPVPETVLPSFLLPLFHFCSARGELRENTKCYSMVGLWTIKRWEKGERN
jgi:hypothetical protein